VAKTELPPLGLTLSIVDGKMTTGHQVTDERIAHAIVEAQMWAKKFGKPLYVFECRKNGPTISTDLPDRFHTSFVQIYPGGRQVFMPLRKPR
jgi:hypothetical protein